MDRLASALEAVASSPARDALIADLREGLFSTGDPMFTQATLAGMLSQVPGAAALIVRVNAGEFTDKPAPPTAMTEEELIAAARELQRKGAVPRVSIPTTCDLTADWLVEQVVPEGKFTEFLDARSDRKT